MVAQSRGKADVGKNGEAGRSSGSDPVRLHYLKMLNVISKIAREVRGNKQGGRTSPVMHVAFQCVPARQVWRKVWIPQPCPSRVDGGRDGWAATTHIALKVSPMLHLAHMQTVDASLANGRPEPYHLHLGQEKSR